MSFLIPLEILNVLHHRSVEIVPQSSQQCFLYPFGMSYQLQSIKGVGKVRCYTLPQAALSSSKEPKGLPFTLVKLTVQL